MALWRQWKTLSIRVLRFLDWVTERLLENVSYEKPCDAKSLNILVDGVADGAGEAARRRPSFFRNFCIMMGPNELAKILGPKKF
jgi:hypothetical protein